MADAPGPFDSEEYLFTKDSSGRRITIRPGHLIAHGPTGPVIDAVQSHMGENSSIEVKDDLGDEWNLYAVPHDQNIFDLVEFLRQSSVEAQADHFYFFETLGSRPAGNNFAPNLFAPNLFAPNLFAPNLFAPNLFAPNLFAPNLFAPNLFAPNLFAGGDRCDCSCPGALDDDNPPLIPHLGARPVPALRRCDLPLAADHPTMEIHIIDVAQPGVDPQSRELTGRLKPRYRDTVTLKKRAIDENEDSWADPAMGHGNFVRNIIEDMVCFECKLWDSATPIGAIEDSKLALALEDVRAAGRKSNKKLRLLNLSLAGYNDNDLPGPLVAQKIETMIDEGWLIVAAAGNNASCRLAYPAALPGVVAVGAYGDCGPAWFSNYGTWLDASAPGVNVVARYPDLGGVHHTHNVGVDAAGEYTVKSFDTGWAVWSGTSFAAPFVTARLAQSLDGMRNGRPAKALYSAAKKQVITDPDLPRIPYYGTIVE